MKNNIEYLIRTDSMKLLRRYRGTELFCPPPEEDTFPISKLFLPLTNGL